MNKYLFGFSVILLILLVLTGNIAMNQYRARKRAEKQVKVEQDAVYKMEQIRYFHELEKQKLTEELENTGLCDIILETTL